MKEIAFFDLDDTLWRIKDEYIWIIDKEKPNKPLVELDKVEFTMIKNKMYVKDDIALNYNGQKFYISKDLFDILKKKANTENVERFGISFIPLVKKEELDKKEIEVFVKNIEHLRYNKFIEIGVLTARSNQKTHADLLNRLRIELKKIGIEISKIFFMGNGLRLGHDYYSKVKVLLEHLIGFKIIDGKFSNEKQDWYQKVDFYDDDANNIDYANDIQKYLNDVLRKTEDNLFRIVINKIKENKLILETNLITGNEINRFKRKVIVLEEPLRFPMVDKFSYLKKFEQFNFDDLSDEELFGEDKKSKLIIDIKNKIEKYGNLSIRDFAIDPCVYNDEIDVSVIEQLYPETVWIMVYSGYDFEDEIDGYETSYENLTEENLKEILYLIDEAIKNGYIDLGILKNDNE